MLTRMMRTGVHKSLGWGLRGLPMRSRFQFEAVEMGRRFEGSTVLHRRSDLRHLDGVAAAVLLTARSGGLKKGNENLPPRGAFPVLHGDSFSVRDSSANDCAGNCYKQADGPAGLDGGGVFRGGRNRILDSW